MEPPPGIAPGWPAYRADTSLTMLWGLWKWSARDDLHVQGCLILSQVGLLFPVNHAPKSGVPDRLRSGDLLHERQTRKTPSTKLQRSTNIQASRLNGALPVMTDLLNRFGL